MASTTTLTPAQVLQAYQAVYGVQPAGAGTQNLGLNTPTVNGPETSGANFLPAQDTIASPTGETVNLAQLMSMANQVQAPRPSDPSGAAATMPNYSTASTGLVSPQASN